MVCAALMSVRSLSRSWNASCRHPLPHLRRWQQFCTCNLRTSHPLQSQAVVHCQRPSLISYRSWPTTMVEGSRSTDDFLLNGCTLCTLANVHTRTCLAPSSPKQARNGQHLATPCELVR